MENEATKSIPEEEYQFSPDGESSTAAFGTVTESKANIFDRLKRRNVFILVGVIVVALGAYKIFDIFFTTGNQPHRPSAPAVTTATFPTAQLPVSAAQQSSSEIKTIQPLQEAPSASSKRLDDLTSQQGHLQEGLDKLGTQVSDIQNSLTTLTTQLAGLNESVQTLAARVAEQQQVQLAAVKKKTEQKKQAQAKPKPVYFVRSMIPGRAWLSTSNGETITVSVGSNLPGYGIVQVIDAAQGTITTDSGAIIGYSPSES
jgi:intracellular multiplication protein IcmG